MKPNCRSLWESFPKLNWPFHSRTHLLWKNGKDEVWVKRDDELSVISSGPKRRKHSSFFAKALSKNIHGFILHGSPYSSNTLAMASTCRELGIAFKVENLKLKSPLKGNALWNEMLNQSTKDIDAIDFFNVPEGCNHPWSLPGALTLGFEIPEGFDRVIIDAGTGFTAASLALARPDLDIIVLNISNGSAPLLARQLAEHFSLTDIGKIHELSLSKSLSPIREPHWEFLKTTWVESGIILDPVYTARSFYWTKNQLMAHTLPGRSLLIHTGGSFSLLGFEKQISQLV